MPVFSRSSNFFDLFCRKFAAAVFFSTPIAFAFASDTIARIIEFGAKIEMVRVTASSIIAVMKHAHPSRNLTVRSKPHQTMNLIGPATHNH
jgi:hypothetical protein